MLAGQSTPEGTMVRFAPWMLLAGLLTGLSGCPQRSPPKARTNRNVAPDNASDACATDDDCVLTRKRLGQCCLDCALAFAVVRSRAAAIERWHRKHCKPGTYSCPKVKCNRPKGERRARCEQRRCVTEVNLGQPRGKPKR
jgi:hypothetical protein